jgi:PAS domain S-box-containing protein
MNESETVLTNRRKPSRKSKFDMLRFMGSVGMHGLRTKTFFTVVSCAICSLLVVGAVAFFNFKGAILSALASRHSAAHVAEIADRLMLENIRYARLIANDPLIKDKVEEDALLAEQSGIKSPDDAKEVGRLAPGYAQLGTLKSNAGLDDFLKDKKRTRDVFGSISLTDRYGLNVGDTEKPEGLTHSAEGWWQGAMKSKTYLQDLGFDNASGVWTLAICIAVPHSATGAPNGVLRVTYKLSDVQDYLRYYTEYDSGYAYAVSSGSGRYAVHPDPAMRNQPIAEELQKSGLLEPAQDGGASVFTYQGLNPISKAREERIVSRSPSDQYVPALKEYTPLPELAFVVDNSSAEVYAPAYKMIQQTLIWGGIVILLLAGFAYLFSSSIAAAVNRLHSVTEWVRAGDLQARVDVRTGDELEEVANGFNRMMERLSQMVRSEIEQTKALLLIGQAVESSSDAIVIKGSTQSSTYYNKRFSELTEYDPEVLRSQEGTLELYHDPRVSKDLREAVDKGDSWTGEVLVKTRTGRRVPCSLRANAIKDEAGKVVGRIVIHTDITERRQMEEAIKGSELQYRNLFERANDPIIIFEPSGNILEVNTRACEVYGFDRQEFLSMSLRNLAPNTRGGQPEMFGEGDGNKNFETVHLRKDGTPVHILAGFSSIEYDGKNAVMGIARDITERKKAEQMLERSLDDFLNLVSIASGGDLTVRGNEDVGVLGEFTVSLNKMLDNFGAMLTRVKHLGMSARASATAILAAAEQISADADRQADEVTNTSVAVEEMAASMSQVSKNAEASAEAARRAIEIAQNGDKSVRDTSEAMERINSAVQRTAEKMRMLARRSTEISEIINLINDVAAQTNLLSLNAAIEAAHAGEAGLGFTIVAEEIRKLAERSARSTRDVSKLIKAIQDETQEALAAMEDGMSVVREGSALSEQARQSLQGISGVVSQSARLIEEISAASEEQAKTTRNMAGAMQMVSGVALDTSAGARRAAKTIQGMVQLSEELNEAIARFIVSDNGFKEFSGDAAVFGQTGGTTGSNVTGVSGAD